MSFLATVWAGTAPVADTYERCLLFKLANHAGMLGTTTWPSKTSLAKAALCDTKTVQRRLRAMEKRGIIAPGDQRHVEHIRSDRRPVVYDLLIPRSWFSDQQWNEANEEREAQGLEPIDPATRPDLVEPPQQGRAKRSDAGAQRQQDDGTSPPAGGLTVPPHDGGSNSPPARGDSQSATGGLTVPHGGSNRPPNQLENQSLQPSNQRDDASDGERDAASDASGECRAGGAVDGWMDDTPSGEKNLETADTPPGEHHVASPACEPEPGSDDERDSSSSDTTGPPPGVGLALLDRVERAVDARLHTGRDAHAATVAAAAAVLGEQHVFRLLSDQVARATNPAGVLVTRIQALPDRVAEHHATQQHRAQQRTQTHGTPPSSTADGPARGVGGNDTNGIHQPGTADLRARNTQQVYRTLDAWAHVPPHLLPRRWGHDAH